MTEPLHNGTDYEGHRAFGCKECIANLKGEIEVKQEIKDLNAAFEKLATIQEEFATAFEKFLEDEGEGGGESEKLKQQLEEERLKVVGMSELRASLARTMTERDEARAERDELLEAMNKLLAE